MSLYSYVVLGITVTVQTLDGFSDVTLQAHRDASIQKSSYWILIFVTVLSVAVNHEHRDCTVYKEVTNSDCYLLGSFLMWSCKINNISEVEIEGFSEMFVSIVVETLLSHPRRQYSYY